MSELNTYLVATLFCSFCAFFIGLSSRYVTLYNEPYDSRNPPKVPGPGVGACATLSGLFGMVYSVLWLCVTHQPVVKLIPIFIVAYAACKFGQTFLSPDTSLWLPLFGLVFVPGSYHSLSYLGLVAL